MSVRPGAFIAALSTAVLIATGTAACSSDDSSEAAPAVMTTVTEGASGGSSERSPDCELKDNSGLSDAKWKKGKTVPTSQLVLLEKRIELPDSFPSEGLNDGAYAQLGDDFQTAYRGLTQAQDQSILAFQGPRDGRVDTTPVTVTTISQEGEIANTEKAMMGQTPPGFDLAKTPVSGYYHIIGADGVEVPAGAAGTEDGQNYASQILPDAFDDSVLWVVMRGDDSAVYKASFRQASEATDCTH